MDRDLFGEVIVTLDDIDLWVESVAPGFATSAERRAYYVERWNVADKVRRAKAEGYFDATIENARATRAFLLRRFGLH